MKSRLRHNVLRNMGKEWLDWYDSLPLWTPDMVVRCPTHNPDGSEIGDDCVRGCGEIVETWSEVYDCGCGIYFSDYAANPPHRREAEE